MSACLMMSRKSTVVVRAGGGKQVAETPPPRYLFDTSVREGRYGTKSIVGAPGTKTVASKKKAGGGTKRVGGTAKSGSKEKTSLSILSAVESLRLLSSVEKLGLLSKAEQAGFSLSKIEQAGLLSFAEESGILSFIADEKTPGLLTLVGLAALGAAGGLVFAVPDDSTLEIALQALGAVVLGGAGAAGLVGGSVLGSAQKL